MYEMEALPELEGEWEWEGEWESEFEAESEEFFRRIAGLARRAASSPALRQVALRAARGALSGMGGVGSALGGAIGGARGASLGRNLGAAAGRYASGRLPQREWEYEGEFEGEYEGEWEVNPIRRVYPQALMEHLGHAAAEAESEEEAEAFLGALVPLAARLIPRAASSVMRVAPSLIRGVAGAARTLRRNPATRPLVRTLPTVVRQTTASLARQASQGRPVTPQSAVRTLAQQTRRMVGSPQRAAQAYRRSRALDRNFHRSAGPAASATGPAAGLPAQQPCTCGQAAGNGSGAL
jgi:hypothetical protein